MSKARLGAVLLLGAAPVEAPPTSEQVIDRQLAAYNAQDADAFAGHYAPDARIYEPAQGDAPKLEGRAAIRAYYAASFRRAPGRRVVIAGRLRSGAYITDHERLSSGVAEAIVTYQVEAGLIRRAWIHVTAAR